MLDQIDIDSDINQSHFKGILRLTLMLGLIYVLNSICQNVLRQKSLDSVLQDFQIERIFKEEIWVVLSHWLLFIVFAHLGFFCQKLLAREIIGFKLASILSMILEYTLLSGGTYTIYKSDTLVTTRFVDFFIMMPHFFKMNSFSKTNRDYYFEH